MDTGAAMLVQGREGRKKNSIISPWREMASRGPLSSCSQPFYKRINYSLLFGEYFAGILCHFLNEYDSNFSKSGFQKTKNLPFKLEI